MYSDALDVNSDNNVLLCSVLKTIVLVLNVYCGIIERLLWHHCGTLWHRLIYLFIYLFVYESRASVTWSSVVVVVVSLGSSNFFLGDPISS